MRIVPSYLLLSLSILHPVSCSHLQSMQELQGAYRSFPRREAHEAAVIEWGHSAIITAIDASVANFGPQTNQAALLEVEAMPILADPLNGVQDVDRNEDGEESGVQLKRLRNHEEVHGNMVVMTNQGRKLTGVQMAKVRGVWTIDCMSAKSPITTLVRGQVSSWAGIALL